MEIWKQYENTEYYVSNKGRIFSFLKKQKFKCGILKKWNDGHGYHSVSIHSKKIKVHILVAKLFLKNEKNKTQVNHKNCVTTDNCVENLEWVTPKENMKHASRMKVIKNQFSKKQKVAKYDLNGNFICVFNSPLEAALSINEKDSRGINDVCRFKQKTYRGFLWRYIDKEIIYKIKGIEKTKHPLCRKVGQYDLNGNLIKEFESISLAAKETNDKSSNISCVLTKRQNTSKGFIWKYINV